jgi:chromosome segregation ATPase
MSEETTQNMPDDRSFEERVFARFDALDTSMRDFASRLQQLEAKTYDTKPIWEHALKEISDTRAEMREGIAEVRVEIGEVRVEIGNLRVEMEAGSRRVERKIDILNQNILDVRADQRELEERVTKLEPQPTQ